MIEMLGKLKFSVVQYIGIMAAATIGALLVALRIQGGRLHKTQVALLLSTLQNERDRAAEKVATAKQKYNDALAEYQRGKK